MKISEENILEKLNEAIFTFQFAFGEYPATIKMSFDVYTSFRRACIKKFSSTRLPDILVEKFSNIEIKVNRKKTNYLQII